MDDAERERLLAAALTWARAVQLQHERVNEHERYVMDEAFEGRHVVGSDDESRAFFDALRADRHFLVAAARNFERALNKLGIPFEVAALDADHVRHLRNCLEHFDAGKGPSFDVFYELVPDGDPNSHQFGVGGTIIGGVNFDDVVSAVTALRVQLLMIEAEGWPT